MEQQLATTEQSNATAIYQRMPDPMTAIQTMGKMFAASGMFGCTKQEQGEVLALACMIEGKSPFELMRRYHIIGGNLSMKSTAMLSDFIQMGGEIIWHSALNNTDEARADFVVNGRELRDAAYTIEDAKREGLVSGSNPNWKTRPAEMMRARLVTKALRMIAPGIVMGVTDDSETTQIAPTAAPLLTATVSDGGVSQVPAPEPAPEPEPALEAMLLQDGVTEAQAVAFVASTNLLEEGKTLHDLTPAARKRIMKNYPSFLAKVQAHQDDANE